MEVLHHLSSCESLIICTVLNSAIVPVVILNSVAIQNGTSWLLRPATAHLGAVTLYQKRKQMLPARIEKSSSIGFHIVVL